MKTVRWGLIGCGDISRKRIAPALNELDCCELVAVARNDASQAESFAQEFGAKRWYQTGLELLLDDEIDAVYIATPVHLHAEQAIEAARAGKHVLCEKPMALNAQDCDRMMEACAAHGVKLGVAYYRHHYPVMARIKEILQSGEIGTPVLAEIHAFEWFDRVPGEARSWLLDRSKSGGGPMMDFGCHRIEVLMDLFGAVSEVQSQLLNLHFEREVEDTACASILFENRVHAVLRVSHAVQEARDTLETCGTKGTIRVPVLNEGSLYVKTEAGERTERHPPHPNFHLPLIENFTAAVIEGNEPIVNGATGKGVTEILDRIYERAWKGQI